MPDIHFQNILAVFRIGSNPFLNDLFPFVGASSRQTGIAVLIHALAEHRLQSVHNVVLNNQLFHCGNDNNPLFARNAVININRHMLGVLIVVDPVVGQGNQSIVGQVPAFHDSSHSLAVFRKVKGDPSVFFGYAVFVQVVIGFHILSYPLIRVRHILSY